MSYGSVYNKSTVRSERDRCSLSGDGHARSNDLETARGLASGLGETLGRNNEMVYEAHIKSRGGYDD